MGNGQMWLQMGYKGQPACLSLISWWPYKEIAMNPGDLKGIIIETDNIERVMGSACTSIHRHNLNNIRRLAQRL
jgi:hypothetical protein